MSKVNEKLNIYPLWNLDLPKIPERAKLFNIKPIGIGTPEVESFTGYLNRLAQEHGVSPTAVIRYLLQLHGNFVPSQLELREPTISKSLNGANDWAYLINKFLIKELSYNEIECTTFLPLKNIISKSRLIRQKNLWCPLCLEEQKKGGGLIYEHLTWNIALVEVCSVHKIPLINNCPSCGLQVRGASLMPYGYCRYCFSWLGFLDKDKAFKTSELYKKKVPRKLFWIEEEIKKIVELFPVAEAKFTKENYKQGIVLLIKKLANGNVTRFCSKLKIEVVELDKLLLEDSLISISQLINLCHPLMVSPLDLISGKTSAALRYVNIKEPSEMVRRFRHYPDLYLEKEPTAKTRKVSNEKIEAAKKIMMNALEEKVPPTFEEICRKVEVNGVILKRVLPLLSQQVRDRYLDYKEKTYKSRWQI